MSRWAPEARERLETAALDLFVENGYEETTVTQIADRAGLNRATFFRHFTDKREVLFGGEDVLAGLFGNGIRAASPDATLTECLQAALAAADVAMTPQQRAKAAQRVVVLGANTEVQERGLLKHARLGGSIGAALRARGADELTARLGAEVGMLAFTIALERWMAADNDEPFSLHAAAALSDLQSRAAGLAGNSDPRLKMRPRFNTVVFDLGGVLIDWNPRYLYRGLFGSDEAAMERFLAEVCTPAWNSSLDAGRAFADGVAELVAAHPDQADLISAYDLRWKEMLGEAFEGTVAILRELRDAGFQTYALSNWSAETFPLVRQIYPFLEELDGVLISGEAGVAKPDPAIFRDFMRRFAVSPDTAIYVDDWDRNVAVASSLGFTAIRFLDPTQLRADLRALGLPLSV